jgi:two-component system LytT family response regulator
MLRILVLEDEDYTLRFLEKIISEHPMVKEITGTTDGQEAIRLAGNSKPDIVFLDIELAPGDSLNGIEVAKAIYQISPGTTFVFITGYSKYAIESFAVHPYDYVLKPIKIDKVMNILTSLSSSSELSTSRAATDPPRLVIRTEGDTFFINIKDIYFIEKQRRKALIHTKSGIKETTCRFSELEELLTDEFIRVHKSFIINMDKISHIKDTGYQSYEVHFAGYNKIALISRNKFREHQDIFSPSF